MSVAPPGLSALLDALDDATSRFSALLRRVEDGSVSAIGDWTIGDVAAHMTHGFTEVYPAIVRGDGSTVTSTAGIARMTDAYLSTYPERDPQVLAGRIDDGHAEFQDNMRRLSPETELAWHAQIVLPVTTMAAIVLGEVLIHGHDVAVASGQAWTIDADSARTATLGLVPLLPHYVDREATADVRARVLLSLRGGHGGRARFVLAVDRGTLTVEDPGGLVDCRISADPSAFMLVSYGRLSPLRPALTGKIVAYGRKPWLGLKLSGWLTNP